MTKFFVIFLILCILSINLSQSTFFFLNFLLPKKKNFLKKSFVFNLRKNSNFLKNLIFKNSMHILKFLIESILLRTSIFFIKPHFYKNIYSNFSQLNLLFIENLIFNWENQRVFYNTLIFKTLCIKIYF